MACSIHSSMFIVAISSMKSILFIQSSGKYLEKSKNITESIHIRPLQKNIIQYVKVPTLFLTGELDKFAVPEEAYKLYELCGAKDKKIFEIKNARHSHLRYDNLKDYDAAVIPFLKSID